MSGQIFEIKHPLVKHKLGFARNKGTNSVQFRQVIKEISVLLAYEATKELELELIDIETPMAKAKVDHIKEGPIVVSILRAGSAMMEGILDALPFSSAGHIGIYRDKFIQNTVEYYFKMPEKVKDKEILLVDPMIASGDTIVASIDRLKNYEVGKVKVLTVLASKDGIDKIKHFHPDVDIYTAGIDSEVSEAGYLLPGIGDAGDRLFQTR